MGMHSKSLTKTYFDKTLSIVPGHRWNATPGVIPAKTVEKRRARNKAARRSRAKNR